MHNRPFLSQRMLVLGPLVAVHGVIGHAMTYGLAHKPIKAVTAAIETEIVQEIPRQVSKPPPLPMPEMRRARIEIPPPEVDIQIPLPTSTAITDVTTGLSGEEGRLLPPPPSGSALKPATRYIIHARVGKHFPNPDAFYPSVSIRREEQGVVGVQVCIGPDGVLAEEPSVVQTSGSARLDAAALKLSKSGHYLAGSIDGRAITDCLQLPIRFQMKQ